MNDRFDSWVKQLGTARDRRGMLRAAAGGALGLVGLAALTDGASAKQCDKNKDCPNSKPKCKKGKCVECQNNGDCKNDERCNNKDKCVKK